MAQPQTPSTNTTDSSHASDHDARPAPDLGLTMTQVLRNPLAALRASMETLASEFRADDPRATQLNGALEQVLKMSRDVDALMHFAAPRPLAPLSCSFDEILHSALRRQRFEHASRVRLASSNSDEPLVVDGPLLADCLARLLENALSNTDDWILLSARRELDWMHFGVVLGVDDRRREAERMHGLTLNRIAALELGLTLAQRDVKRMNARLDISHTPLGNTCISVLVPMTPPAEESSAS